MEGARGIYMGSPSQQDIVSYILAGVAGGLLMGSVFMAVGPVMIFVLAKNPSAAFETILNRISPRVVMIGTVIIGYPFWVLVGAGIGLLCWASTGTWTDQGLGSSNLLFTTVIVMVGVAIASPLIFILKRVFLGTTLLTIVFIVIFGWVVPFLATN